MTAGGPRGAVHRYMPFLLIAALQLAVLTFVDPKGGSSSVTTTGAQAGISAGDTGAGEDAPGGATGSTGTASAGAAGDVAGGAGVAAASGSAGAGGSGTSTAGAGRGASGPAAAGPAAAGGDKSRCAPGGVIQQNVTSFSPPCVPKFVGDNGGATSQGVTKDTVTAVYYLPKADPAINAALATQGLSITPDKNREILGLFEKFFNKHYEFYGRTMKWVQFDGTCDTGDFVCYRNDAKAVNQKLHPFVVVWYGGPWQFADELSRYGVIAVGSSWGMPRSWYVEHRPYAWDLFADGDTVADTIADYWCKKMRGKPATEAGDPTLQVKTRKLAIISNEDTFQRQAAERLKSQVNGGMCGSPADGAQTYYHSVDSSKAQEQYPTLVQKIKADGNTTVVHLQGGAIGYSTYFDNEHYFPEHLLSGVNATDHDMLGRFATPSQWTHAFGPSWRPKEIPIDQQDDTKAVKDVAPEYKYGDSYVALAMWLWTHLSAMLIQSAGPNLTPATWERGAFTMPQFGGWTNTQSWPGWHCCDPLVVQQKFSPGHYAADLDAKEVYWDPNAPSPIDNKPGHYVCVNGCRRFEVGKWPQGDPKK